VTPVLFRAEDHDIREGFRDVNRQVQAAQEGSVLVSGSRCGIPQVDDRGLRQDRRRQGLDDGLFELVVRSRAQGEGAIGRQTDHDVSISQLFPFDLPSGEPELGAEPVPFGSGLGGEELGQFAVEAVMGVRIVRAQAMADHPAGIHQGAK